MAYVSCRTAPPPPEDMPGGQQQIICTDDQGVDWWLTEDSEVGDWLRFKEGGGKVAPYRE